MKFAICLTILLAYATAASSIEIDLYKNTLVHDSSRIIGGEEAARRQFPYQVSVRWSIGILGYSHICGGTLINKQWVLTAGHCKQALGKYEVGLGLLELNGKDEDSQHIKVDKVISHREYPGGVAAFDIALLKLSREVELTDSVQIANLPTAEECDVIQSETLSGWGLTSNIIPFPPKRLRWASLPRITNQRCEEVLIALLGNPGPLDSTMICTGSNIGKSQSACSGDSGGPLVKDGKTVVGVVSWGLAPCGIKDAPSVYTNVCSHLKWIDDTIKFN